MVLDFMQMKTRKKVRPGFATGLGPYLTIYLKSSRLLFLVFNTSINWDSGDSRTLNAE